MTPDGLFGWLSSVACGVFVLATDQTVVFWNRRAREILGYAPDRVVGRRCSGIAREVEGLTLTDDCAEGCLLVRSLRAGLVPGRARLRMRCASGERKWLVVTPMVVSGVEDGGPLLVYLFGDSDEEMASADVERLVDLGRLESMRADGRLYVRPRNFLSDPRGRAVVARPSEEVDESDDPEYRYLRSSGPRQGQASDAPDDGVSEIDTVELEPREVSLTEREGQVLSYLALGWETKYIAEELGVSPYTARNHIENLRRKLGASTRLEAVMTAMRLGIIPPE